MDARKPFLRYTEHPPDAQRDWDLPPAVFVPLSEGGTRARARVYMPTSLFNYLARKVVVVKLDASEGGAVSACTETSLR
ncbi:hypothetical protein OF83DRAFT_45170 [Amylostereum chailletii]|nr:hypothetical protein OF83DRAFT_45170 [Amylostereum chailletii]